MVLPVVPAVLAGAAAAPAAATTTGILTMSGRMLLGAGAQQAVRAGGANIARTAATAATRGAATRGTLLGRAATAYTATDIFGDILKSFLSGGASGVTGGFLGGDGNAAGGRGGSSSLSSSASLAGVGGAGGNFSDANKENCCCCRETLSLLSSIDRTLKIGLNVSKAELDLEASRNASEKERMAESKLPVPGLGGSNEKLRDMAEEAGFNVGKSVLDLVLGNAGAIIRGVGSKIGSEQYYKDMPFEPGVEGRRGRAILGAGEATGMASGGLIVGPGGPTDDKIPVRLSNGEYVVNARSTRANLSLLNDINRNKSQYDFKPMASGGLVDRIGSVVGESLGGLRKDQIPSIPTANINPFSIAAQNQKQGEIIGSVVGESLGKSLKEIFKDMNMNMIPNKIAYLPPRSSETPKEKPPGKAQQNNMFSQIFKNNSNSLVDLIGKVESRGDPNVFRKGGEAVEGHDLQNMTIDEVLALGGTAYGKHQFIPETLRMLARDLKLDTSKVKFTEAVQDKLANHQLMKIKSVQTAIKDPSEQNIKSAMTDISYVWRGLPDPEHGLTYQDKFAGGNKAGTSVGEFKERFVEYLKDQRKSPLGNVMDMLKKPGQMLDQIALMGEANKNKQMASAGAPVVINNQSGGQQQRMPTVMLPIDGPTLPNSMVAAVSQFSSSRYA